MTGKNVLNAVVKKAATAVTGTAGPPSEDDLSAADPTTAAGADEYNVEYTMQTGLTRYAPMQPVPGTKVTATNTKPMFPTSSVPIAKSKLPIPSQVTTLTATQTFSTKSVENTVCHPRDCRAGHWTLPSIPFQLSADTFSRLLRRLTPQTTWPSSSGAGRTRHIFVPLHLCTSAIKGYPFLGNDMTWHRCLELAFLFYLLVLGWLAAIAFNMFYRHDYVVVRASADVSNSNVIIGCYQEAALFRPVLSNAPSSSINRTTAATRACQTRASPPHHPHLPKP